MPTDLVDDLEHAEDTIRTALDHLEQTAHDLHACHGNRHAFDDCPKEACVRSRKAIAEVEGYTRATVEDGDTEDAEADGSG